MKDGGMNVDEGGKKGEQRKRDGGGLRNKKREGREDRGI